MSTAVFDFDAQLDFQNSITIENIGDFGLEAINELGEYYYLAVKTFLGVSVVASCGPIIPDVDMLPSGYNCSIIKMPYREDKLQKNIKLWLNDKFKKIRYAELRSFEEVISSFKDITPYLNNLSEDTF